MPGNLASSCLICSSKPSCIPAHTLSLSGAATIAPCLSMRLQWLAHLGSWKHSAERHVLGYFNLLTSQSSLMSAGCSTQQDWGRATLLSVGVISTSDNILMLSRICTL